jgi:hypothetical protein
MELMPLTFGRSIRLLIGTESDPVVGDILCNNAISEVVEVTEEDGVTIIAVVEDVEITLVVALEQLVLNNWKTHNKINMIVIVVAKIVAPSAKEPMVNEEVAEVATDSLGRLQ